MSYWVLVQVQNPLTLKKKLVLGFLLFSFLICVSSFVFCLRLRYRTIITHVVHGAAITPTDTEEKNGDGDGDGDGDGRVWIA